jgi:threonine dehydratase
VRIAQPRTIADGVATQAIGRYPFVIMQRLVSRVVTVDEDAILRAVATIMTRTKQVVEPTGALTTAAILEGAVDVRGRKVMSLLCGGNIDLAVLQRLNA